jgi:hypothetical protein
MRCKHQESSGTGCRYQQVASGCKFIHIQTPWGTRLDSLWEQSGGHDSLTVDACNHVASYSYFLELKDNRGTYWHTAKYSSVEIDQAGWKDVIFAEGGNSSRSSQGVHWYRSKSEACRALEKSVIFTFWAIQNRCQSSLGILGPFQLLVDEENRKRQRINDQLQIFSNKRPCNTVPVPDRTSSHNPEVLATSFVRLQGAPVDATKEDIDDFFLNGNSQCESIVKAYDNDGDFTGTAYVSFRSQSQAQQALALNNRYMGSCCIKLFQCGQDEFESVQFMEKNFEY